MKAILIGFPKSGTSSFRNLFESLGFKTLHWKFNDKYVGNEINRAIKEGKEMLYYLRDFDCIAQMDVCESKDLNYWHQTTHLERLYEENKETLFILNIRNPQDILTSMKNWRIMDQRILTFNKEGLPQEALSNDEKILLWITNHYNYVRDFFSNKGRFVEYDIQKDKLSKLNPYFDILENISKFPHTNKWVDQEGYKKL